MKVQEEEKTGSTLKIKKFYTRIIFEPEQEAPIFFSWQAYNQMGD